MSLPAHEQPLDGLSQTSSRACEPYEPSVVSTAPSSQASIFSDTGSGHSSIASSVSDDFRLNQDEARDRACAQAQIHLHAAQSTSHTSIDLSKLDHALQPSCQALSYADVTSAAPQQRQHPRRSSLARNQKPPSLQRQQERKTHFVDSLVDSASQMVEVIWPLSGIACKAEGPSGRGVLPLRTYIEETLRRSRTSYSTLQVALYYLVLIKPFVPKGDLSKEPSLDHQASRALMCGRRMFLAALILASKYLQDRNYSAKAWSKMSGLSVPEINSNERNFLAKVDFKLHIPDPIFTRWTEIVLRFTPNTQPPPPGQGMSTVPSWKSIIPILTPALDTVSLPESAEKPRCTPATNVVLDYGCISPTTPTPTRAALNPVQATSTSHETTPTPMTVVPPRFLEPRPEVLPPTPALARLGPLPTPQLTPSSNAASTPAASACSSRRPSMCSAMALAQQTIFNRCAVDTHPCSSSSAAAAINSNPHNRSGHPSSRRPSITSATSSRSSPESMVSDRSRCSRASSISSVSTMASSNVASMAPHPRAPYWVRQQATCRNYLQQPNLGGSRWSAAMPPPSQMHASAAPIVIDEDILSSAGSSATQPIVLDDDGEAISLSPPQPTDFAVGEKKSHVLDRHTKSAVFSSQQNRQHGHLNHHHHHSRHLDAKQLPSGKSMGTNGRKRGRNNSSAPRPSSRRSDLQEEVRLLLLEEQRTSRDDTACSFSSAEDDDVEIVDYVDLINDDRESSDDTAMDVDECNDDVVSCSPAVQYAARLLRPSPPVGLAGNPAKQSRCRLRASGNSAKETRMRNSQPLSRCDFGRVDSCRLPVLLREDGSKRFCRAAAAPGPYNAQTFAGASRQIQS